MPTYDDTTLITGTPEVTVGEPVGEGKMKLIKLRGISGALVLMGFGLWAFSFGRGMPEAHAQVAPPPAIPGCPAGPMGSPTYYRHLTKIIVVPHVTSDYKEYPSTEWPTIFEEKSFSQRVLQKVKEVIGPCVQGNQKGNAELGHLMYLEEMAPGTLVVELRVELNKTTLNNGQTVHYAVILPRFYRSEEQINMGLLLQEHIYPRVVFLDDTNEKVSEEIGNVLEIFFEDIGRRIKL
jgi:hypothetical protein